MRYPESPCWFVRSFCSHNKFKYSVVLTESLRLFWCCGNTVFYRTVVSVVDDKKITRKSLPNYGEMSVIMLFSLFSVFKKKERHT